MNWRLSLDQIETVSTRRKPRALGYRPDVNHGFIVSSLAFGGPDLRTVYLGCLLDDGLYRFRSPVAGRTPFHWHYDDPP